MINSLRKTLLMICLAVTYQAWGGEPQALIQRMNKAMAELSYKGTLVYSAGGQLEVIRVIRRNNEQGLRERIFTLSGTQRELLRDKDKVRCLLPNDRSLTIESQWAEGLFPEFDLERWQQTKKYYRYKLLGIDRVAGRTAQILDIRPLESDRYGYRLWVDEKTNLLLKSSLNDSSLNDKGARTLQQIVFTDIEIGSDIPDEDFKISQSEHEYLNLPINDKSSKATLNGMPSWGMPSWQPAYLPDGFSILSHQRLPVKQIGDEKGGNTKIVSDSELGYLEHSVYSDGLASLSLYVEKVPNLSDTADTQIIRGGTAIVARSYGEYLITAVGEMPVGSLRKIVDSVARAEADTAEQQQSGNSVAQLPLGIAAVVAGSKISLVPVGP